MIGFAETTNQKIRACNFNPQKFQREAADLFGNEKFLNSIRQATSDETAVRNRIDIYRQFLDSY